MKNITWIFLFMIIGLVVIFTNSCKKDDKIKNTTILPSTKNIHFNDTQVYGTLTDIDGNVYKTISIAKDTLNPQTWMAENLKVTHYRNGELIPNVTNAITWRNTLTGACCDYNNTPEFSNIYGKLYNLFTVIDSRNVCPSGWHIPSDADWSLLTTNVGGQNIAGQNLKETGIDHWQSPIDTTVKDTSGFAALPGGFRNGLDGSFNLPGYYGYWWSSTKNSTYDYIYRSMGFSVKEVYRIGGHPCNGFSVRCIKDSL